MLQRSVILYILVTVRSDGSISTIEGTFNDWSLLREEAIRLERACPQSDSLLYNVLMTELNEPGIRETWSETGRLEGWKRLTKTV